MRLARCSFAAVAATVAGLTATTPALAASSLYSGPGHRPGPDLLYARPAVAPQLTNRTPWRASPILVSGAFAYRAGEFVYQDFLYDDNGAREAPDPSDPRAAGNLFSKPNGTYTYPSDPRYANNAADIVELRVKPLRRSTAFRLTLNTLKDPSAIAFSIAIGGKAGHPRAFPFGANVRAPARFFLTVHPAGSRLVGQLVDAVTGRRRAGPAPRVSVDRRRRQIDVRVSHRGWNPHRSNVRLAAGVGLWDKAAGRYLLPQASADAGHPGGAGSASQPAAFFNVAFRRREPLPSPEDGLDVIASAAWWRDRDQGTALAAGDISRFSVNVSFRKLARKVHDEHGVPRFGPLDRILPSHFETAQGANFSESCISMQSTCTGQYRGRLEPYAIYVPRRPQPRQGFGLTLLLHSLSAAYNQYLGTRNQSQFALRGPGSIVITPEARGPDEFYENYGAADVFDVWNDVARRYRLDPAYTVITGYSMGGIGTFKLGAQFPDLFARAQPTVGDESVNDVLGSLRNVPVLMWNNSGDELVQPPAFMQTAQKLDSLGYRYELDTFQPCANAKCSPLFPNHLELAVNDQYAPAAAFLGTARVNRNPAHVTFVEDAVRNHAGLRLVGDHAYWVSQVKLRSLAAGPGSDPEAQIDAVSKGFGTGDPAASLTQLGTGTLTGGYLGPLTFASQRKTWGGSPKTAVRNEIDITAKNVGSAVVDVRRAHVNCHAAVKIDSDGPILVALPGCGRIVRGG
jgi:hypothetical protein